MLNETLFTSLTYAHVAVTRWRPRQRACIPIFADYRTEFIALDQFASLIARMIRFQGLCGLADAVDGLQPDSKHARARRP